jgi:hypothetical protein
MTKSYSGGLQVSEGDDCLFHAFRAYGADSTTAPPGWAGAIPCPFHLTTILITAFYYDTYLTGEPDEALRLMNVIGSGVDLTNWTVTDGEGTLTLQGTLPAGASIWIARQAVSFTEEFGFSPD